MSIQPNEINKQTFNYCSNCTNLVNKFLLSYEVNIFFFAVFYLD